MPIVKLEAQLSKEDLLEAVQQLTVSELEDFLQEIIDFRAKKLTNNISEKETNLLLKINQNLTDDIQKKYQILIRKRQDENLTNNEYQELLNLTDVVEKHQAQRLKYLVELATLRECSLNHLMDELGINPTENEGV
jgi:uncharacterized protein YjgD (DUF1641 family)